MSGTEYLFTTDDVNLVTKGKQNTSRIPKIIKSTSSSNSYNIENLDPIYNKLSKDDNPKYFYEKSKVDNIYAIGDINADYLTLVKMLIGFKLIKYSDKTKIEINNPELISNVEWAAPKKTILVICGNIIGGWNSGGYSTEHRLGLKKDENTDVKRNIDNGDNEMLIHMFLRNIKLLAKENNSDVMLVYGGIKDNLFHSADPAIIDKYDKTNYSIPQVAVDKYSKYPIINGDNYGTRYNLLKEFYRKNVTLYFAIIENGKKLILSDIYILFINGNWLNNKKMELNFEEVKYLKPLVKDGENEHISQQIEPYKMIYKPMKDFKSDRKNAENLKEPNLFIRKDFDIRPTGNFITVHSNKPNSYQRYAQKSTDERPCSKFTTNIKHMDVYFQSNDSKILFKNTAQCIYPMEYNENNIPQMININSSISDAEQSKKEDTYSEILKITNINESPEFYALSLNNNTVVKYKLNTDEVREYVDTQEETVKNTINKTHHELLNEEDNGKDRFINLIYDLLLVSDGSITDEKLKNIMENSKPNTTSIDGGKKRKQRRYLKSKKARKSRKSRRKSSKRSRGRR